MAEILEWKCPRCNKTHDGTVYKCSCGYVFLEEAEPKIKQESAAGPKFKNREAYEAWKARKIKEAEEKRKSLRSEESNITHYYEILGLKPGASEEEIKQAYRDLSRVWHPDRFARDSRLQKKAEEKMKEINEAYQKIQDYLNDPYKYKQPPGSEEVFQSCPKQSTESESRNYSGSQATPTFNQNMKETIKEKTKKGLKWVIGYIIVVVGIFLVIFILLPIILRILNLL